VVRLKSIGALFTGSRPGPSLNGQPPDEYMPFLAMIEQSAIECCEAAHRVPTDDDFEHLYLHLRRRPDGTHADPLFSYMQAAARLYMSLRDVSRAEFEAIAQRLTRSARHFSFGAGSTNYFDNVGAAFR
jgi:hypothetical protein